MNLNYMIIKKLFSYSSMIIYISIKSKLLISKILFCIGKNFLIIYLIETDFNICFNKVISLISLFKHLISRTYKY
jgi:hypothetical protein